MIKNVLTTDQKKGLEKILMIIIIIVDLFYFNAIFLVHPYKILLAIPSGILANIAGGYYFSKSLTFS